VKSPPPKAAPFFANLSPVLVGESGVIGWVATMQDVSHFAELNELKDEFVNMVSHDLRSPLSAILIATELLPMLGDMAGRQNDLLDTIKKRVQDMQELINDLLDVGKIESGTDFELELCQLNSLVNEVIAALTAHANAKAIHLSAELSEDLPPIMANPLRMRQVIHNLTDNALKYTPREGRVTLKAYPHGQEIRLQVIDTGIGIPAADQPHIFEKFHRVRDKYVAEVKGTGLGLAITKNIIEKHNGRIWVESVHGQGSTFTVALPIHQL
jgi:two-component system phosphate regulon sensor histidine kinase PhoR